MYRCAFWTQEELKNNINKQQTAAWMVAEYSVSKGGDKTFSFVKDNSFPCFNGAICCWKCFLGPFLTVLWEDSWSYDRKSGWGELDLNELNGSWCGQCRCMLIPGVGVCGDALSDCSQMFVFHVLIKDTSALLLLISGKSKKT